MFKTVELTFIVCIFIRAIISLAQWCPKQNLCQCKYDGKEVDLRCVGTKDLLELKQCLMENFSNFTIGTLYVKECNASSLPPRIIENLAVRMLYMKCPLLNFSVDAFVGSYQWFKEFRLYNHKLTVIPDAFASATYLQRLRISNGSLESVGEEMRNLKNLKIVSLRRNKIKYISPNAFTVLTSLTEIYSSNNLIKYIDSNAFVSCRRITTITLSNNHLESAEGLLQSMNPTVIHLENNNLTDIHIFHARMRRTTKMFLSNNPVGRIDNLVFHRYFVKLVNLELANMSLTDLAEDAFAFIPELKTLDLSRNEIESIPYGTFNNLSNLITLDLSQNKLSTIKGIFNVLVKFKNLFISDNRIFELEDSFNGVPNVENIDMDKNKIQVLNDENFKKISHLKFLSATRNKISIITKECFKHLIDIRKIDLTGNLLVSLNGSIQNLQRLNKLILPYNRIERLEDDDFANLPQLLLINLQGNQLSSLNGQFRYLHNLEYLNLRENRISSISNNVFPNVIPIKRLFMEGNPLVCDCRLSWLKEWSKMYKVSHLKDNPLCQGSHWLKEKYFKNISINDLVDWKESCILPCKCTCVSNELESGIHVNCAHNNLTDMPEIFPHRMIKLDLSHNNLTTFHMSTPNSSWFHHLKELDIENNQIVSVIGLHFLKHLSTLKMANNNLEMLSVDDWANYSLVTLSENPWLCDCSTTRFRDWVFIFRDEIIDINQTKCARGNVKSARRDIPIIYLSESEICPPKLPLDIIISIGILGLLLFISSSAVTYFRYGLNIKIWLYSHGFTWIKEDDIDKDKEFDAFISYSSFDNEFVHKILIPTLENSSPPFFLCIHERNFPAGNDIQESIVAAVKSSRRTILVLSKNFLESEWCILEFRAAHLQALTDRIKRVIIIVYGEIPSEGDIDEELKIYLKNTTYLIWGEKYFWEKLHYALPKIKNMRECVPLHYDKTVNLLIGF